MSRIESSHVINEIHDVHFELEKWITGKLDYDYSKIDSRQARDFTIVNSTGKVQLANQFNKRFENLYGKYPDAKLKAEIVRVKRIDNKNMLVVYRQKAKYAQKKIERLTTAIFKYAPELKNGCQWTHVHETNVKQV